MISPLSDNIMVKRQRTEMLGEECSDPKCKMDDVDDGNEVIYDITDLVNMRRLLLAGC